MPHPAPRPCNHPGCPRVTQGIYCDEHLTAHRAQLDRERGVDRQWYASRRWRALRAEKLRKNPLCETPGCRELANEVHHVIDRHERPDLAFAWDNLASSCKSHHSSETRRRMNRRARRRV